MFSVMMMVAAALAADVDDEKVTVEFQTSARKLVVSKVDSVATVSSAYGSAAAVATSELCIAPCTIELDPGMYRFYGRGGGQYVRAERFTLDADHTVLEARTGSTVARWGGQALATLGLTAAITGGTFVALADGDPALKQSGTAALAGGLGAIAVSVPLFVVSGSKWEAR